MRVSWTVRSEPPFRFCADVGTQDLRLESCFLSVRFPVSVLGSDHRHQGSKAILGHTDYLLLEKATVQMIFFVTQNSIDTSLKNPHISLLMRKASKEIEQPPRQFISATATDPGASGNFFLGLYQKITTACQNNLVMTEKALETSLLWWKFQKKIK